MKSTFFYWNAWLAGALTAFGARQYVRIDPSFGLRIYAWPRGAFWMFAAGVAWTVFGVVYTLSRERRFRKDADALAEAARRQQEARLREQADRQEGGHITRPLSPP